MAEFTANIQPVDLSPDVQYDPLIGQKAQANALSNIGAAQNLQDRATFRAAAPGLVARDPTATGQAMGANPTAAMNYLATIPSMDANTRAQAASDIAASGALAGSVLNAPPDQRQAAWAAGRQQLIAGGHRMPPGEAYPGDAAMLTMRGLALTAQEQFQQQAQVPTTSTQPLMMGIPGGGSVGPGGQQGAPAGQPQDFNTALAQSESSGDPTQVNAQGYAGTYQFGAPRMADLGFYQPAPGEIQPNGKWGGTWNGTITIPGYPQVKTLADFRNNISAQNAVQAASVANIDQAIAATPGAQAYDQNGLRAVAHLGGIGGMQRFVATGGKYNPSDANGTSLGAYYQKFSSQPGAQPAAQPVPTPVRTASAAGTAGMPATTSDATHAPPPPRTGVGALLDQSRAGQGQQPLPVSLGATPGPPQQPAGQQPVSATPPTSPNGAPLLLRPQGDAGMPGAPDRTRYPVPGQNALSGIGAGAQPAPAPALSGVGQGAQTAAAAPPLSSVGQLPAPPTQAAAPASQPQGKFLYRGGQLLEVPGQPGFAFAQMPDGSRVAQRIPGAPGAGVDTQIVGGTAVSTDKQTGGIVSVTPGIAPNTARVTQVDAGDHFDLYQGNQKIGAVPKATNPIEIQAEDYKRDQGVAQEAADDLAQSRQTDMAIREQRGITSGLTQTGAFGERKAQLASYLESTFSPDVAKAFERTAGLDDASQSEQFAKTALAAAGAQENANVGARGGFQLTRLYTRANPGLGSQPNTIRDIQNLQAISNLSQQDYASGLLGYINQNSTAYRSGGQYTPSTNFSQAWNSGNNPQVYVAAAEALNQKPYAKWSRGLSPEDQQRALAIAARADNAATYVGPNGPAALTPYGAPKGQSAGSTQAPASTAGAAPPSGGAPPAAVAALRQNPGLATQFDAKYGQGASRGVLGQ